MATETLARKPFQATRRTRGTVGRQRQRRRQRPPSPSPSHHRHSLPTGLLTALVLATIPTAAISTPTSKACGSVHFAHPAPDLALFRHDTINVTYESSFAHPSLVCLCGQGGRVSESRWLFFLFLAKRTNDAGKNAPPPSPRVHFPCLSWGGRVSPTTRVVQRALHARHRTLDLHLPPPPPFYPTALLQCACRRSRCPTDNDRQLT